MDKNKHAIYWETVRLLLGLGILFYFGDWFGLNSLFQVSNYVITTYLLLSFAVSLYFVTTEFKVKQTLVSISNT